MSRVIPDDVKGKVWLLQPLLDHSQFPGGDPAVQVPRHHNRNWGVKHRQESPDHPEDLLQISVLTGGLNRANIKTKEERIVWLSFGKKSALESSEMWPFYLGLLMIRGKLIWAQKSGPGGVKKVWTESTFAEENIMLLLRTGALETTKVLHCVEAVVFSADVEPDHPARVNVREELQVAPDPPPVPPRQISVEGEGDHSLPGSSPRTGRTAQVLTPIW